MYVLNGIAYAGNISNDLSVAKVKILDEMYILVEFSTGEQRLLDANVLLEYPIYKKLLNPKVFQSATVEDGVLVWLDGEIDVGTTTLYRKSFPYDCEHS